jgi:hypothetical protein
MFVFVVEGEMLNSAEGWFSKPIDQFEYLPSQNEYAWWNILGKWSVPGMAWKAYKDHGMSSVIGALK